MIKLEHVVVAAIALVGLYVAIDQFYQHPTCGRGVKAAVAAANMAGLL